MHQLSGLSPILFVYRNQLRCYPIEGIKFNTERNGPPSTVLVGHYPADFHYHEGLSDELPEHGMSLDYIKRDTRTAIEAVGGDIPIYPGIGINIPAPTLTSTPQSVKDALYAAFEAGATGVLLARNYMEMDKANMRAAGEALADIKARYKVL